jgi:hypothetical protein
MCVAFERECVCGKETARLHHLNTILSYEAVRNIYCPSCSVDVALDSKCMVDDNGWVIEFDMELVQPFAQKMGLRHNEVTPGTIFDQGFCSWQGFTPNDLLTANKEKAELAKIAGKEPEKYFRLIREWTLNRASRLREEGWRKARETATEKS